MVSLGEQQKQAALQQDLAAALHRRQAGRPSE